MPRKVKSITPDQVDRMSAREIRAKYTEYRDIAQKRIKRLAKAGYEYTDLYQQADFPKIKGQSLEEIKQNLQNVSEFLKDPRSLASKMRSINTKISSKLKQRGFNIEESELSDFGKFMKWVRERYNNRAMPPSDDVVQIYEQAERLGISTNVLRTKFKDFISDSRKAEQLAVTLTDMELPEHRQRITSTEVKNAFNDDWGFND